jgi:hypothetical protein
MLTFYFPVITHQGRCVRHVAKMKNMKKFTNILEENSSEDNTWEIEELKLKLSHYTPRRRLGERRYSSYSFSTWARDGSE